MLKSTVRIVLMLGGLFLLVPATMLFGPFGFFGMLFFLLLVALAS